MLPLGLGHALAIGVVILLASFAGAILPLRVMNAGVAVLLVSLGILRLFRHWHPRFGGMQVGFRDLTFWSFLMASAHGAGFMLLPLLLGLSAISPAAGHVHTITRAELWTDVLATLVHTLGYLGVTCAVAWLVYAKLGLALLRRAWLDLDLVWAAALVVTGCLTPLLSH